MLYTPASTNTRRCSERRGSVGAVGGCTSIAAEGSARRVRQRREQRADLGGVAQVRGGRGFRGWMLRDEDAFRGGAPRLQRAKGILVRAVVAQVQDGRILRRPRLVEEKEHGLALVPFHARPHL